MNELPASILLVGAGKMGGALLRGWLDAGFSPERLAVADPHASDELKLLAQQYGFALNGDPAALAPPEVFVLAVKPQMLAKVAPSFAALNFDKTVVVSVMAGKTIMDICRELPAEAVVRSIPNTPAAIGRGITGAFANPAVRDGQRHAVHALLACVGQVEWLEREDLIDAVTAVSGSGPAYVFLLTEYLAEAARAVGLEAGLASRLARATVEGAGALMIAEPETAADQLRRNVTSPAGTTAAAIEVFNREDALRSMMIRAVTAARDRAAELAG